MAKLHNGITSKEKEEKELALSLFRIPINFFSEDNKKDIKTSSSNSDEKLKINSTTSPISNSDTPDKKIKLSPGETAHTTIEIDLSESSKKVENKKESSTKKANQNEDSKVETTPKGDSTSNVTEPSNVTKPSNQSNDSAPSPIPVNSQQPTPAESKFEPKSNESTPLDEPANEVPQNNNTSTPLNEPTAPPENANNDPKNANDNKRQQPGNDDEQPDNSSKDDGAKDNDGKNNDKSNDNENDNSKTNDKGDKDKDKDKDKGGKGKDKGDKDKDKDKAKALKDKFGKTKPGKKLNDAKDNAKKKLDDAKGKAGDKLKNSKLGQAVGDKAGKAGDAVKTIENAKEAAEKIKDGNLDGVSENVGEIANTIGKNVVEKVGNAYGGWGTAAKKVIEKVNETKLGKSINNLVGKTITCGCFTGCLVALIALLLPLLSVAWIANLFGGNSGKNAVTGELTEDEFKQLQEASKAYSMISYEEDTTEKNRHTFWKELFGTDSAFPIQDSLEDYLKNHYSYTKELAEKHNDKYKNLIEKHFIMEVDEGELTSFGLSFELLIAHYNLTTLKAPGSSPQRDKSVDDKNVTYYLETNGAHMQLFEDVLNCTDPATMNNGNNLLVLRFNGQVSEKWLIDDTKPSDFSSWLNSPDKDAAEPDWYNVSLATMLNTPIKVYIKEYNEYRDLSLRDLLKETSTNNFDTQYYTALVRSILSDPSYIGNVKLNTLFYQLTKKLASLELMTYMLYYQKYQTTMEDFLTSVKRYNNGERFSESFFEQFLTFTHVEHFIALSGAVSEPSLAYEIAVASFETVSESIKTEVLPNNYIGIKQFTNWYATYHFENSVYATNNGSYNFYMTLSDVTPTYTQQYLFDKYNINRGVYDTYENLSDEEKEYWNKNDFFELFEDATGIDTAFDANGNISMRAPGGISYECAEGKFFPIDSNANAVVTLGYDQEYSTSTIDSTGVTHKRHHGIDYGIPVGTELFAVSSGYVTVARHSNEGYGNYIQINHDDGFISIYAHGNGTFHVNVGDHVEAGQAIMQSGNSGASTGPHLHFEMYDPHGNRINPDDYLYGIL